MSVKTPSENNGTNGFFYKNLTVFFKHTDIYGFVHPYNFLEWTSYVREAFFQTTVTNFKQVLQRPVKMMTARIFSVLLADAGFGDQIAARLSVDKIKKVSFDMIVRFYHLQKNILICETRHTVVFVDADRGGFAPIPSEMGDVIVCYRDQSGSL